MSHPSRRNPKVSIRVFDEACGQVSICMSYRHFLAGTLGVRVCDVSDGAVMVCRCGWSWSLPVRSLQLPKGTFTTWKRYDRFLFQTEKCHDSFELE